jgi:hypothetical protein
VSSISVHPACASRTCETCGQAVGTVVLEGVLVCRSCHDELARPARIAARDPDPREVARTPLTDVLNRLLRE